MKLPGKNAGIPVCFTLLALLLVGIGQANGEVIDTTTSWDGSSFAVGNFTIPLLLGEPDFGTIGQTFTVGADNVLDSFTFWLDDIGTDPVNFAAFVMEWDGSKATGSILFESAAQATSDPTGRVMEQFTFNTGGLVLTPGTQYVAFLNTSNFFDNIADGARVGSPNVNAYNGGEFVVLRNGSDFSKVTTFAWDKVDVSPEGDFIPGLDAAFRASFSPEQCTLPPSGMVSWWDGDAVSGSTASDIQNGNDGTLVGDATTAPGQVGDAFSFDGVDDYVLIGNPANLRDLPTGLTIDAWVNPTTAPAPDTPNRSNIFAIVTKWGQSDQTDAYGIWLHNPDGVVRLIGGIDVPGSGDGGFSGGIVPVGQWTHVAMTYDSATGDNKLYVNGVEVAQRVRQGGITVSDLLVLIAREDSFLPRPFHGLIDEVEIFNRALTQQEIQDIFDAGSAGKCKVAANEPPLAVCQDIGLEADATCQACGSIDGGSFDPDGPSDIASITEVPGCPYELGVTAVTLTIKDLGAETDSCGGTVMVNDTTQPTITCPAPQTSIECMSPNGANVMVNATATDNCGVGPLTCDPPSGTFPIGTTAVQCTATDDSGNQAACGTTVTVVDTFAPVVQCNSPYTIVPPDAPISFTATAMDICGDVTPEIREFDCFKFTKKGKRIDKTESCVVSITGDTITIVDSGGVGDNITWTVTATDGSGNIATTTCELEVVNPGNK